MTMTTQNTYVVTGTMSDEQTVVLDEPLPIKEGRVRLIVETIGERTQKSWRRFASGSVSAGMSHRRGKR